MSLVFLLSLNFISSNCRSWVWLCVMYDKVKFAVLKLRKSGVIFIII